MHTLKTIQNISGEISDESILYSHGVTDGHGQLTTSGQQLVANLIFQGVNPKDIKKKIIKEAREQGEKKSSSYDDED